jgi:hypothetical protein
MCIDLNAPQKPYLVTMAQLEVQCHQLQQHEGKKQHHRRIHCYQQHHYHDHDHRHHHLHQQQQHEHKALGIGFHSNQSNTTTLRSFTPSPVSPYSLVLQLEPLLQF